VFAAIFAIEAVVKMIGFGYRYFKDGWNIFDLVIVIITIVGIVLSESINV
jgi:voltage-gated sodium channel